MDIDMPDGAVVQEGRSKQHIANLLDEIPLPVEVQQWVIACLCLKTCPLKLESEVALIKASGLTFHEVIERIMPFLAPLEKCIQATESLNRMELRDLYIEKYQFLKALLRKLQKFKCQEMAAQASNGAQRVKKRKRGEMSLRQQQPYSLQQLYERFNQLTTNGGDD